MENIEHHAFCASCQSDLSVSDGQSIQIPDGEKTLDGLRSVCPICGATILAIEE